MSNDSNTEREARYAEAIYRAAWPDGGKDSFPTRRTTEMIVPLVVAVADAEQSELRAEVERLQDQVTLTDEAVSAGPKNERATPEAELAALRGKQARLQSRRAADGTETR